MRTFPLVFNSINLLVQVWLGSEFGWRPELVVLSIFMLLLIIFQFAMLWRATERD